MAESTPGPAEAAAGGSTTASKHPSDHVNLRVTYLIAGNPRPPHELGLVPASTTVGDLRIRLQQELLEHPLPHEQRLIYQGRPLMQSNATLREALRLEGPIGPLPYTLHIIISSRPASSHFRPSQPVPMSQQPPATPSNGLPPNPLPNPQDTLGEAERIQALAQQQLTEMQRQMAILNPALAQAVSNMGYNVNTTIRIQNAPAPHARHHHHHLPNLQPLQLHPQPPSTHANSITAGQPGQQGQGHTHPVLSGPQTQPQSNGIHPSAPGQQPPALPESQVDPLAALRNTHGLEPIPRSSSAPGIPPTHPAPPFQLPQHAQAPSMSRTSQPFGPNPLPFPHHGLLPLPFPFLQNSTASHPQPTVWLASSRNGPEALLFAPGHGYYTTAATAPTSLNNILPSSSTLPTVNSSSVLSGSGPQPTPTPTTQPPQPPIPAQPEPGPLPNPNALAAPAPRQRNANPENDDIFALIIQRGWLFLRLYMFMFVLSEPGTWRRYLLLTLAVIVCILPRRNPLNNAFAAARRHIDNLIGPPHPQPRDRLALRGRDGNVNGNEDNPAMADARARLDAAVARTQQEHQAQTGNQTVPAARSIVPSRAQPQGAVNTTPEETARRLLREHEARNPIIQIFYRLEQAVALFLASLIPGVGERHVAAREEVRREEERARLEEQARREAEEKKRLEELEKEKAGAEADSSAEASAGPSSEDKGKGKEVVDRNQSFVEQARNFDAAPDPGSGSGSGNAQSASSSAVETRQDGDDELRARFT